VTKTATEVHPLTGRKKTRREREHMAEGQRLRREREHWARCVDLPSGKKLDLRHPSPDVITVRDVATRLAACPRFAGEGISVAAHSVLVCQRLREQGHPPDVQMAGLLHDCAEFATGDLIRPVKLLVRNFRGIERGVEEAVMQALGLAHIDLHDPDVKAADEWSLSVETGKYDGPPIRLIKTRSVALKHFLREYSRCKKDLTCPVK
jgi:uncharacterized protein